MAEVTERPENQGVTTRGVARRVLAHENAVIGISMEEVFNGKIAVDSAGVVTIPDSDLTAGDLLVFGMMRQNGSLLTSFAFSKGLGGEWGSWLVTIGVFLFAISTMISWSYYGDRSVQYLWGDKMSYHA